MKRSACLPLLLTAVLLCSCGSNAKKAPTRPDQFISEERQFAAPSDGDTIAIFSTSLGEVRAVLYPDAAPMAVYNFVGLARSGYYDGTIIWRSQYGFAVQGGDATGHRHRRLHDLEQHPLPAGGRRLAEALRRGAVRGLCSGRRCHRRQQPILLRRGPSGQCKQRPTGRAGPERLHGQPGGCLRGCGRGWPYLDNTDTVFGQVYQGMDVVDAMACVETTKDEDGNDTWKPTEDAAITIEKVTITTYPGPAAGDEATSDSSVG